MTQNKNFTFECMKPVFYVKQSILVVVSNRIAALRLLCTQCTGCVLEKFKRVPIYLNREIFLLDKQLKVNLHGGSLEIPITVPLI